MLQFGINSRFGSRANSLMDQYNANPGKKEINKQHASVAESMVNRAKRKLFRAKIA
jgi:hypothetical protein